MLQVYYGLNLKMRERPDDVFEEVETVVKEETEKERKRRIRKEKRNEKKKEKR